MRLSHHGLYSVVAAMAFVAQMPAASVEIKPVADTTLIQIAPTNNMGGKEFINSGTTQVYTRNRALIRFNPANDIPIGSRIEHVELILEVTKEPDETPANSLFTLHRVLVPWGEGAKTNSPGTPGQGQPATECEATWIHRFSGTTNTWSTPGASATNDFVADVSASQFVMGRYDSPYIFGPTTRLISDVQFWIDQPDLNFGWILVCQSETESFTARRFGSKESGIDAPRLFIEYVPPPQIESVRQEGNDIRFAFSTEPNEIYKVQFRNSLSTNESWTVLTNVPGTGAGVSISDVFQPAGRFYRIRID
jgi:hypothetical protein